MTDTQIKYLISLLNKILDKLEDPNSNWEGLCHLIAYGNIFSYKETVLVRYIVHQNVYTMCDAPATIPVELIKTNKTSAFYWRKYSKKPRILFIKTLINLLETNPKLIKYPKILTKIINELSE